MNIRDKRRAVGAAALLMLLAWPVPGGAQEATTAFVNLDSVSGDYRVGPGDVIDLHVVGHDQFTTEVRVSNSGEISLPMLGILKVAELTMFEIEDLIAAKLKEKGLIENAQVLGMVSQYQAKPVYVQGAVVQPGEFIMSQELTVADAILLAGGLQFNAADEALIHRRVTTPPTESANGTNGSDPTPRPLTEILKVDLKPLKEGRFQGNYMTLKRGDVIRVPEMQLNPFYVVGEVLEPRNYFYQPGQTLTASQAISWAKGPVPTAKLSAGMLIRYDKDGNRKEIPVDYGAILKGEQADFTIEPNDIIFIPGSRIKTIGHGLLMLTDTMVMQQTFRIARRYQLPEPPAGESR